MLQFMVCVFFLAQQNVFKNCRCLLYHRRFKMTVALSLTEGHLCRGGVFVSRNNDVVQYTIHKRLSTVTYYIGHQYSQPHTNIGHQYLQPHTLSFPSELATNRQSNNFHVVA